MESIIYLSPLIVLLSGVFILMFSEHSENERHGCFSFAEVMLSAAFACSLIFYNKPLIDGLTTGEKYTFLFECLLYAGGFVLLSLSRRWFASMNITGYIFCGGILSCVLFGSLLAGSHNLFLSVVCCTFLAAGNAAVLKSTSAAGDMPQTGKVYIFAASLCALLAAAALAVIYRYCGSFDYAEINSALKEAGLSPLLFAAAAGAVLLFMFLLGLAPFHFWLAAGENALPVFAYFVLLPGCAVWCGFIRLNHEALAPYADAFALFYEAAALLSVIFGAAGACSSRNVRRILSYITVYYSGMVLLAVKSFTHAAAGAGLIYLLACLAAMYGICICLFGLKSKGEYLSTLGSFEGVSAGRPFIAAMLAVFMFSLIGLPPLPGFPGMFAVLSCLAEQRGFGQIFCALAMTVVLSYGCLQIIKSMYFTEGRVNFDRTDPGIYTALFLAVLLTAAVMLCPGVPARGVYLMTESMFK